MTRKEPITDGHILASIRKAGGIGRHHPVTGHYGELVLDGISTIEEAREWSRSLYRCAHYLNRTGRAPVSMSAKIERDGTGYRVRFKAIDKAIATKWTEKKYGSDRSKWPYTPSRRRLGGN